SGQVKTPRSCNAKVMAKAWASHGSRNTGPSASRGTPGTATAARMAARGSIVTSGWLQIGLPGIDGNLRSGVAVFAPQFASIEAHGVKPLRVLAGSRRIAVGEDVAADDALDRAQVAAYVARKARVRRRVDIFCAHSIAHLECRLCICVALGRAAA